jgi:hypothetical protein
MTARSNLNNGRQHGEYGGAKTMRKPKYVRGEAFSDLDELAVWCAQDRPVFWSHSKAALPGHAMLRRQFSQVAKAVARREVAKAELCGCVA